MKLETRDQDGCQGMQMQDKRESLRDVQYFAEHNLYSLRKYFSQFSFWGTTRAVISSTMFSVEIFHHGGLGRESPSRKSMIGISD